MPRWHSPQSRLYHGELFSPKEEIGAAYQVNARDVLMPVIRPVLETKNT